mmetsp:Transcript_12803/g.44508  ORF Transcript_12803/g.44508 Transcript_12803/m.44508 type:complete len:218 (+) Transcript_12803:1800-2453(+)
MATCTLCRSNCCVASYSIDTNVSPPETDGQQLMDSGTTLSSLVCMRHLRIPRAEPVGNGRLGSLRPRMPSLECSALSMLGCVLNWKPRTSPVRIATRTYASSSLATDSSMVPCTSRLSMPPSFRSWHTSFSSMATLTGSWGTAGAAEAAAPAPGADLGSSTSSPSAFSDSRKLLVFALLPSTMPFLGPALALGASAPPDMPPKPPPPPKPPCIMLPL